MELNRDTPVGAVVAERLGRAQVFDRLGIDYCCHGATSLGAACSERALDVDRVITEIVEDDRRSVEETARSIDYSAMALSALAEDIVRTHHAFLRRELPRLSNLADKVVSAHGGGHPELADLRDTLTGLRQELELHMVKEERVLFPLIGQLEAAKTPFPMHCGTVNNPIRVMEHEHETAGLALRRFRDLTEDYTVPADACESFKAFYAGLAALENDLHRHIHKENNILFPKAAALESALCGAE